MNILQLLPKLEIGGVEKGTVDLARYLTLNAHKAVVVSGGGRLVKKLDEVGARHYKLPVGEKNPFMMPFMVFKLCEIINRENIDIVHARSRVPALIGFIASRLTHRNFITTAHGQYKTHLMSYVMGWGKLVIVASSVMLRHMIENFGVRPDKIRIIPRGVDTKKFTFRLPEEKKGKEFTIGMISRITPLKGHEDFIRAVALLNRTINKLKVYIVGDRKSKVDYIKHIELLIKRLALRNVVEFQDQAEDVSSFLSKLDVLVSANREQEAFGRILIEAQSAGVPCVATKVGGIVDIIEDGSTGLLCEAANPRDMAEKINQLYKNLSLRQTLAKNGQRSVEKNFSLDKMMSSTLKVYEEATGQMRILIIKISALGDVILSLPSIRAIRAKYPKAEIKVLVGLESKDVLKSSPYVDELIVCDFKKRDRGIMGFLRIAHILKSEDFDVVIDFQNNKRSHLLGFLSCAPLRYGYNNGKFSFLLNRKAKDKGILMNPIDHQMGVLALMQIYNIDKGVVLSPSSEDTSWAKKFLEDNWIQPINPFVCINLESSPRWITKRWPVKHFVQVAEKLAKDLSVRVVITGKSAEDEWVQQFVKLARCKPVSTVGKTTIGQLMALIQKCGVLITSDSAPMHIAAGVKTPFVALFGPTEPKKHVAPLRKCKVINKNKCKPCYKPTCNRAYVCMRSISPDEVYEAVRELLEV